eukprot:TRINITY_DN8023_c0_g1_i7.p4 TRINITY_DN8023_c0_g1~~TRINITY_DN8023_c0_g1_i7.p4  ORF type:complete len:168 (-),score=55.89 TRINITY_DN8023_c0_g1_i7:11-514(-)
MNTRRCSALSLVLVVLAMLSPPSFAQMANDPDHPADAPKAKTPVQVLVINGCPIWPFTRCPGADLRHANLVGKSLRGADLNHAKLARADLSGANLAGANLDGADLTAAKMQLVNAPVSTMRGATLIGADLLFAKVQRADMSNVDMTAEIGRAVQQECRDRSRMPSSA